MSRAFVICLSWNFPASHITLCTHNMGYEEGKTCPQTMYMHPAKMECLLDSLNNTESHSKAFYIVKIRGGFLRVHTNSINQKNFKQRHPFVKKKRCIFVYSLITSPPIHSNFSQNHLPYSPSQLHIFCFCILLSPISTADMCLGPFIGACQLPRVTSLKKTDSPSLKQPSIIHVSSAKGEYFWDPSLSIGNHFY